MSRNKLGRATDKPHSVGKADTLVGMSASPQMLKKVRA
jgi:hypothetical protein